MTRVVVIGGGITGLTTAWRLREHAEVTVLEASERLGGQIRTIELGGAHLDAGADAMLARRPEALALARELGLGPELVEPATGSVWLWVRGRLRPLPAGAVMGVPTDPVALARAGVLPLRGVLRAALEPLRAPDGHRGDRSLGALVTERYGRAVADRLVEPLLSGVYAGSIDRLSVSATTPMIDAARRRGRLTPALRAQTPGAGSGGPVFMTVRGGLSRLVDALAEGLGERERVRTATPATGLSVSAAGWEVDTPAGPLSADHVVVALPAAPAARLLSTAAAGVARALCTFDAASVAVVALAYDHADVARLPEGSGLLVPRTEGRLIKAATWSSRKWPHLAHSEHFLLRASVGRVDDPRGLDLDDEALAARVDAEVREATGITARARQHRVVRWSEAMPQYDVGHLERVERVRAAVDAAPAGLHVGGAALDGVGLPARVQDGARLADAVLAGSVHGRPQA